jgi:hypothetical protein
MWTTGSMDDGDDDARAGGGDGDARAGLRAVAVLRGGQAWHGRGDADGDGDDVVMCGVGDDGAWDGGTRDGEGGLLPPELGLCATPSSSSSGSRMEKGRGSAGFYTPRPLVPADNTNRD